MKRIVAFFLSLSRPGWKRVLIAAISFVGLPVLAGLGLIGITQRGNDVAITFEAEQGVTYQLERQLNLSKGLWQSVPGSDITPSADGPAEVIDPEAASNHEMAFYRVVEWRGIFVDTFSGNDGNSGARGAPKKTIAAGIAAAASDPVKNVFVSKGHYPETITLANGVSLYGGYDAATGWSRSENNTTTIASPSPIAVSGTALKAPLTVQMFQIVAADASGADPNGDGLSSYGLLIRDSPGPLTLDNVSITAGNGSIGLAGLPVSAGLPGTNGGNANGRIHGEPGPSPCGAIGGLGADAVNGTVSGLAGGSGIVS